MDVIDRKARFKIHRLAITLKGGTDTMSILRRSDSRG